MHVIGAGFGRTGTMSLKLALEELGLGPCYHMAEVFQHPEHIPVWRAATRGEPVDWHALFRGYRSAVDWPTCSFWRELADVFPDARFLLSVRDPDAWHRSVCNTIYHPMTMEAPPSAPPFFADFQAMAGELILEGTFRGRILDREFATAIYEEHVRSVREALPAGRLIVYEVGSGWRPLCEALRLPEPERLFPRTNTTQEYRGRLGLDPA